MTSRLAQGLRARLEQSRKRFTTAHVRIVSFDFRMRIATFRLRLDRRAAELGVRSERFLRAQRDRFERLRLQLDERSPLKVLERGYAIATDAAGNILKSVADVNVGDTVTVQLRHGQLTTAVRKKEDA
jgi:exodeoxyribonuclease VII large subunit